MDYNKNSDSEMYDESGPSSSQSTMENKPKDKEESEGTTALLPKSILAGKEFKPGEEVVLKIVHIYDDDVEVEYATGKEDEEKGEGEHDENAESESEEDSMMM